MAFAPAASAFEVLTVLNPSPGPMTLACTFRGEAPLELTGADGTVALYQGQDLQIPAGKSAAMMFRPWGETLPVKFQQWEAQAGVPARTLIFEVRDAQGVLWGAFTHVVASDTGKAVTVKAGLMEVKKQADHTVLILGVDGGQLKTDQAKCD